ncbi:MAG: DUF481 domain-containing protein [Bacteroidales bacterium]|nr:DUF481 domain-containing protein [Bacteroidales bacterium]
MEYIRKIIRTLKDFRFLALLMFLMHLLPQAAISQADSVVLKNGNYVTGEIKEMTRGVLTIETDYSDKDFSIEWSGVKEIYSITYFLVSTTDGIRFNGTIETSPEGKVKIITDEGPVYLTFDDVVYLQSLDKGFWDQLYATIDIGFNLTKANNLQQWNSRATIGYLAKRWSAKGNFNQISSVQDDVGATKRSDGGLSYRYYLPTDFYILGSVNGLSNTEQKLDLRLNATTGIGKYAIHTNSIYWGFLAGVNYNNESYSGDIESRESWEGVLGTEYNMFDVGDIDILTKVVVYPGITEQGRWRSDFEFDTKYDLPYDFYIHLGFTLNYDNQPAEGASETDYVLQTGLGWEW